MKLAIRRIYPWFVFVLVVGIISSLIFIFLHKPYSFEVVSSGVSNSHQGQALATSEERSPLSGLACANYQRRPMAVMLSSDEVARPLSGLSAADLVVEMPVIANGITRLMAVYLCDLPEEIGSVRSARHDFIPLAQGLDAIYVHWGGSHFALEKLNQDVIDNLDALANPYESFYRKPTIAQPHNGFTGASRLLNASQKLGYRLTSEFEGYPHQEEQQGTSNKQQATSDKQQGEGVLTIGYPGEFNVKYQYDPATNHYLRERGTKKEIDRNDLAQVTASVVIIMRTQVLPLEGQYNDVVVEGQGQCQIFQSGQTQAGTWQKDKTDPTSKLKFLDQAGQEIKFVPGQIWLEIVEQDTTVSWQEL